MLRTLESTRQTGTEPAPWSVRTLLEIGVLFAAYVVTARLGLLLDTVGGFAALVWPPSGIALYALLRYGYRLWPGVFAGALVANLLTGAPALAALGIAGGNSAEALLATFLLRRVAFDLRLGRVRDVGALLVLAGMISTAVSATVGVTCLWAAGIVETAAVRETWRAWWLGDGIAVLTIAPLLMVLGNLSSFKVTLKRVIEAVLMFAFLTSLALMIFGDGEATSPFGSPYLVFPGLLWASMRFTQPGAVTAIFVLSVLTIVETSMGHGRFAMPTLSESLFHVQIFMSVAAVTALMVAAAVSERDRARTSAEASLNASRYLARASTTLASTLDYDRTLQAVAQLVVPVLADNCVVDVLEADGSIRTPRSPVTEVQNTRKTMTVPLRARGEILGAITFGMAESGRSYTDTDIQLAEKLGDRAGVAIDNARLYDQAVQARTQAEEAAQVRDDFLAVAGHELRTPLTALMLHVQSLQRAAQKDETPEKLAERLAKATGAGHRLESLINQMLDVSRITAGRLQLEPESFNLETLVREVVDRFADQAKRASTTLSVHSESSVVGTWDRLRIDQVISNLVSNAIKYGGGKPVELEVRSEAGLARLRVTDHGIGIDPAQQPKIFERFERAVASREFGGFGLGLWIARQIVEASGGAIEVQSALGEGATFTVRLPVISPAREDANARR